LALVTNAACWTIQRLNQRQTNAKPTPNQRQTNAALCMQPTLKQGLLPHFYVDNQQHTGFCIAVLHMLGGNITTAVAGTCTVH
jgi:hypothetical protein